MRGWMLGAALAAVMGLAGIAEAATYTLQFTGTKSIIGGPFSRSVVLELDSLANVDISGKWYDGVGGPPPEILSFPYPGSSLGTSFYLQTNAGGRILSAFMSYSEEGVMPMSGSLT